MEIIFIQYLGESFSSVVKYKEVKYNNRPFEKDNELMNQKNSSLSSVISSLKVMNDYEKLSKFISKIRKYIFEFQNRGFKKNIIIQD